MLTAAREIDRNAGLQIDYKLVSAEETGLPPHSADVVICEYFGTWKETEFINLQSFSYDETAVYAHAGWQGRVRAPGLARPWASIRLKDSTAN